MLSIKIIAKARCSNLRTNYASQIIGTHMHGAAQQRAQQVLEADPFMCAPVV
jgi:hypothetical protein